MRNPFHAICPYFAMFPESFVEKQVAEFTDAGDLVFDPFSGRGTTLFQALLMGRAAAALDINPVAYCISAAKGNIPERQQLLARIAELEQQYDSAEHGDLEAERRALPQFFRRAFYHATLRQILFLRHELDWQDNWIDCFVAVLVLGSLHGEMDKSNSYFSNQMPRTISTKPAYSIKYWRERNLWPRKRKVFDLLRARVDYRYRGTRPDGNGMVALGDVRNAATTFPHLLGQVDLFVTSPPYYDVTNFEEDQWLRLWFLGGVAQPTRKQISADDRYYDRDRYWTFLAEAWDGIVPLAAPDAVLVCRIGATRLTIREVVEGVTDSLTAAFPGAALIGEPQVTTAGRRQTDNFRPGTAGCRHEVDLAFDLI